MRVWLIGLGLILIVGCASENRITSHSAAGNLEARNPLACVSAEAIRPENTAADIAVGALACTRQSDFKRAAELLMVSNAYAYFDTQRVADRSAHGALSALYTETFSRSSDQQMQALFAEVESFTPESERFREVCRLLEGAEPPNYHPRYMIAHGMQAFTDPGTQELVENFDARQAWMRGLEFVNCDEIPLFP